MFLIKKTNKSQNRFLEICVTIVFKRTNQLFDLTIPADAMHARRTENGDAQEAGCMQAASGHAQDRDKDSGQEEAAGSESL